MRTKYRIIEAHNLADLVYKVNEAMLEGWGVVGGHVEILDVQADMYWCSQSMIRVFEEGQE